MNKLPGGALPVDRSEFLELQSRLGELEAVIQALREHQVDAIVGESDVALVHLREVEEALRESGERYRAFVANSSESIWRFEIDPPLPLALEPEAQVEYIVAHGFIAECNDAMAQMYGYERATDLLGRRLAAAWVTEERLQLLRDIVGAGYRLEHYEMRDHDRHGRAYWVAASFMGVPRENMLARIWGVQRDITERRRNLEDLRARSDELAALLAITRDLASNIELNPLLDLLLTRLRTIIPFTGGSIAMREGDRLVVVAYDGPLPRESVIGQAAPLDVPSPVTELLAQPRPVIFDDVLPAEGSPAAVWEFLQPTAAHDAAPSRSWLLAPLLVRDRVMGLLTLEHGAPNQFSARQAELTRAFADHAAVAIENARLYGEARQLAALNERQRLAAELHDSVSQSLYGIALGAHTATSSLDKRPERVRGVLEHIVSLAEAAFSDMRSLIFELRPQALAHHGLVSALGRQADILRTRQRIKLNLDLCPEPNVPLELKEELYRIAQESMNNIVKHAQATEVWLRLALVNGDILLDIRDDGRGFDSTMDYPGHLGLRVMRERAERIGATVHVSSAPERGASISVRVPVPPS